MANLILPCCSQARAWRVCGLALETYPATKNTTKAGSRMFNVIFSITYTHRLSKYHNSGRAQGHLFLAIDRHSGEPHIDFLLDVLHLSTAGLNVPIEFRSGNGTVSVIIRVTSYQCSLYMVSKQGCSKCRQGIVIPTIPRWGAKM